MSDEFAFVEDNQNLVRSLSTNAIINTDRSALALAKAKKLAEEYKLQEQQNLKNDVDNLKKDMSDIKSMLTLLIERN